MLNKLDDFPIHQTPEPIAVPATGDRNVYDRTWFNGYASDGSYYFGIGIAIYPHRGILDCAFSVVQPGGRQLYVVNGKSNAGPNPGNCRVNTGIDPHHDDAKCCLAELCARLVGKRVRRLLAYRLDARFGHDRDAHA